MSDPALCRRYEELQSYVGLFQFEPMNPPPSAVINLLSNDLCNSAD